MFQVDIPDDFLSELTDFQFEMIAEEALKDAVPILERSVKNAAKAVIQHEGESDMVNSIKAGDPTQTKTDAYMIKVEPSGFSKNHYLKGNKKKRHPVSNALKLIWMEYGIQSAKHHQVPRPILERATKDAQEGVLQRMQETYDRLIK